MLLVHPHDNIVNAAPLIEPLYLWSNGLAKKIIHTWKNYSRKKNKFTQWNWDILNHLKSQWLIQKNIMNLQFPTCKDCSTNMQMKIYLKRHMEEQHDILVCKQWTLACNPALCRLLAPSLTINPLLLLVLYIRSHKVDAKFVYELPVSIVRMIFSVNRPLGQFSL